MTSNENLMIAALRDNIGLPANAIDWLLCLYHAIQFFDDVADGDKVERDDLNKALWNVLIGMGQNDFYRLNAATLSPMVASMILKWQASDYVEKNGKPDACSFVWRAAFFDVVLMVVQICKGPEYAMKNAHVVMAMYGEKFEDYLKEFA